MIMVSYIDDKYLSELENLVFFNPHQFVYLKEILKAINDYGIPKLNKTVKGLNIIIEGLPDLQTFFFLEDNTEKLIGFTVLYREDANIFTLLHIAISNNFTSLNHTKNIYIFRILSEIIKNIKQIKNVQFLKILYGDRIQFIKVQK